MHIENMYKYKKDEVVYVGGMLPEGSELLETMDILTAEDGFDLIRISDDENLGSNVWLKDGDSQDNYKEEQVEILDG